MGITTILYVFAGIGILDTLYLIYNKLKGTEVYCLFFPKEWCYKVQHSKQSKTFGVPNSVAGFVLYSAIFILTMLWVFGSVPFWPISALVVFGFCFSLYFMFVQAFVLRAFCTWCVLSFINFTVMFWAILSTIGLMWF